MSPRKPAPPTRRVNRGGGHSYFLDGESAFGVTRAIGEGYPKPALIGWAFNTARDYVVDHWDELSPLSTSKRIKAIDAARYADRDLAGKAGRMIHTLAERLTRGEEVDVPEHLMGHVDAYLRFVDEWEPRELLAEAVVLNRRFNYMGTLDMIGVLEAYGPERWLIDYKSTRSGVFSENACQLAGYRFAETYLDDEGLEQPLPTVDRTAVLWLRADGYDLIPVRAGAEEFRIFLYALGIARFREDDEIVGEALAPPTREGD